MIELFEKNAWRGINCLNERFWCFWTKKKGGGEIFRAQV